MDASTTTEDFYAIRNRKKSEKFQFQPAKTWTQLLEFFSRSWRSLSSWAAKLKIKPVEEMYIFTNTEEALDYIDERSRIAFPGFFIFMMFCYWTSYLYIIEDKLISDTF